MSPALGPVGMFVLAGMLLLCCQAADTPVAKAKFVTCPACRLNSLPEVKRFLKTEIEPGNYEGVTVEYIFGHNPELVFFDAAGTQVLKRRVDDLNYQDLHDLLKDKGFKYVPKPASTLQAGATPASSKPAGTVRRINRRLAGIQPSLMHTAAV